MVSLDLRELSQLTLSQIVKQRFFPPCWADNGLKGTVVNQACIWHVDCSFNGSVSEEWWAWFKKCYLMEFQNSELVNIYTLQYIFLYVQYMYGCIKVMTVRLLCVWPTRSILQTNSALSLISWTEETFTTISHRYNGGQEVKRSRGQSRDQSRGFS